MKRAVCPCCQRPQVTCICHLAAPTKNQVQVVILQHPSEVKQSKGTVTLLKQSLQAVHWFVGEDFTENNVLQQLLASFEQVALLYPSEQASLARADFFSHLARSKLATSVEVTEAKGGALADCALVILDGTWKKAYKMFMHNAFLADLPHLTLADDIKGGYQIRKTSKAGALSSLEACCYALMALESAPQRYQGLLDAFAQFNQLQLSFRHGVNANANSQ